MKVLIMICFEWWVFLFFYFSITCNRISLTLNMYFASLRYTSPTFVASMVNTVASMTFVIAIFLRSAIFSYSISSSVLVSGRSNKMNNLLLFLFSSGWSISMRRAFEGWRRSSARPFPWPALRLWLCIRDQQWGTSGGD